MNTNGHDANKSRKLKTIIVTIVAAIIIVIVGVWAITSVLGKKKTTNVDNPADVAKTEEKEKEKTEQVGTDPVSPSQQYNPTTQTPATQVPAQTPAQATQSDNIPTTGPSEVIFSAIMLGIVAALAVLNIQFVKENKEQ